MLPAVMEHRLTQKDPAAMTGECARCGPVRLSTKSNGAGRPRKLVCATVKRTQNGGPRRKLHGMTPEEARAFCEGKACAICGSTEDLGVDHCHRTRIVREPLCRLCNLGLGHFRDDPRLLLAAARYVRSHTP